MLWSVGTGVEVGEMLRAAREGDVGTLRKLLRRKPELARCHYNYRTPIYFAVRENRLEAAKLLLGKMGDPLSLAVSDTLLTVARDRGYMEMLALLQPRADGRAEPVAGAIREGSLRKVRKMLDGDPELVRARDERGNQPIHWAVMTRQLKVIDLVLERGGDINAKRPDGAAPIQLTNGDYLFRGWRDVPPGTKTKPREVLAHLRKRGAYCDICTAAYIGDAERVAELLREDAGLANRPSDYITYYACSGTPLRNAAAGGHMEIVRMLLDHGADPNGPEEGIAPKGHALHMAVCNGHRAIVELLLERGAYANVPVESSADTLSAAMRSGDAGMVELLASHGAARAMELLAYYGDTMTAAAVVAANPRKANDEHALRYAAEEGHAGFVRLLLRAAPGLAKRVGVGGKTAEITEMLFAGGMNPNYRDWLGATPLHEFARRGDVMNAGMFLDRGARMEAVDGDLRSTPLGWACKAGKVEMVRFLLGRGAKVDPPGVPEWARPVEWAKRRGFGEVVEVLGG